MNTSGSQYLPAILYTPLIMFVPRSKTEKPRPPIKVSRLAAVSVAGKAT
jgi:hypothetical protein